MMKNNLIAYCRSDEQEAMKWQSDDGNGSLQMPMSIYCCWQGWQFMLCLHTILLWLHSYEHHVHIDIKASSIMAKDRKLMQLPFCVKIVLHAPGNMLVSYFGVQRKKSCHSSPSSHSWLWWGSMHWTRGIIPLLRRWMPLQKWKFILHIMFQEAPSNGRKPLPWSR